MNTKFRGTAYAILSAVIFGLNPLWAQTIYANGGNAMSLAFYRMVFGALLGAGLCLLLKRQGIRVDRLNLRKLFICAAGYACTPMLLLSSYNYLDSGMATTVHFVYPVLVILGCAVFYHERISRLKAVCMVLCVLGILLLYAPGGGASLIGIAIALFSGVTYAFYTVYLAKSGLQELGMLTLMFWLHLFGLVYAGPAVFLGRSFTADFSLNIWMLVIFFAVCNSGLAVTLFQLGTRYVGPQKTSLFSTFEPLTSVLVGIFVYQEAVTFRTLCGMLCILASVILLTLGKES